MNADRLKLFMEVDAEIDRATAKHGAFYSAHHGYAVILEELDEAWDEIKANNSTKTREEMVQVAACAIRYLMDLSNVPRSN